MQASDLRSGICYRGFSQPHFMFVVDFSNLTVSFCGLINKNC